MPVCAIPQNLATKPVYACDYCFSKGSDVKTLHTADLWTGIQACGKHAAWGKRDLRAWWQKHGMVLIEDVLEFCPEIAALPAKSVLWKDAMGRPRDGGSIPRSSVGEKVFLYTSGGSFLMPVDTHNTNHGHVPMYLAELQLPCVSKLQAKLKQGFYHAESEAHALAADEEWSVA